MNILIALEGKLNQGPNIGTKNLFDELSKKNHILNKNSISLVETTKIKSLLHMIVHLKNFDIFHFYSESLGAAFFFLLFKILGKKTVYTVHGNFLIEAKDKKWPINLLWIPSHLFVIKNVDAVIFPSHYLRTQINQYLEMNNKTKLKNAYIIPNGIQIKNYPEKLITKKIIKLKEIKTSKKTLHILSITSFVFKLKTEGVDLLIQVNDILKQKGIETELRIGGIGPKLDTYKRKYQNKKITFLGYCDNKKENEWADIFIHLTYLDNLPFVILNAEGMGIPTIASHVGGIPEIFCHSPNDLVWGLTSNNPELIVKKILELIEDHNLYYNVSQQQYQNVKNNFNIAETTNQLWDLYLNL